MKAGNREKSHRTAKRIQGAERLISKLGKVIHGSTALIRYFDTPHGRVRTLWYGAGQTKRPVYFDLHGGGFVLGGPEMDEAMNGKIGAELGCAVVSIDYAKAPEHPYPYALDQIHETIELILDDAERYGIDTTKVAIGGHSAGANLATALCLKTKTSRPRFSCQILDYPPLDLFTSPYKKPTPKGCIPPKMALMFNDCYISPDQGKEPLVSPVFAEDRDIEGLPPALFILAGMDSLHDEGKQYYSMLTRVGVPTELHEYENATHGFTLKASKNTEDAVNRMIDFLKRYLTN